MKRATVLGILLPAILVAWTVPLQAQLQEPAKANDKIQGDRKLSVNPPEGAIVLFDGKPEQMRGNWYTRGSTNPSGWTVDDKGVATPNSHDISSKQEFGDCYLHVEFRTPLKGSGNSGVGMQGRYEIQILNSHGKRKPNAQDCGAFYGQTPPKVNASKPAGEWQSFDIFFRTPRFDAKGKVTEKAQATVYQNGILIHENQAFKGPTGIQHEGVQGRGTQGADPAAGRPRPRAVQKYLDYPGEVVGRKVIGDWPSTNHQSLM